MFKFEELKFDWSKNIHMKDFGETWDCSMVLPLSSLGISGDGALVGNEECLQWYHYRVQGRPTYEQQAFVEKALYHQYLDSLKPKKPRIKKPDYRMLLCKQ